MRPFFKIHFHFMFPPPAHFSSVFYFILSNPKLPFYLTPPLSTIMPLSLSVRCLWSSHHVLSSRLPGLLKRDQRRALSGWWILPQSSRSEKNITLPQVCFHAILYKNTCCLKTLTCWIYHDSTFAALDPAVWLTETDPAVITAKWTTAQSKQGLLTCWHPVYHCLLAQEDLQINNSKMYSN